MKAPILEIIIDNIPVTLRFSNEKPNIESNVKEEIMRILIASYEERIQNSARNLDVHLR